MNIFINQPSNTINIINTYSTCENTWHVIPIKRFSNMCTLVELLRYYACACLLYIERHSWPTYSECTRSNYQLTISFHRDNLQITSKVPSIQSTNWKPITISSHYYCLTSSKIRILIQRISGCAVEICENFRKATSCYATTFIWDLRCQYDQLVTHLIMKWFAQHKFLMVACQAVEEKARYEGGEKEKMWKPTLTA
jgi:hypothetical protein